MTTIFDNLSTEEVKKIKNLANKVVADRQVEENKSLREDIKVLENPDIEAIKEITKSYVDFCFSSDYCEDNDFEDYTFSTAMEAIYGKDIWDKLSRIER